MLVKDGRLSTCVHLCVYVCVLQERFRCRLLFVLMCGRRGMQKKTMRGGYAVLGLMRVILHVCIGFESPVCLQRLVQGATMKWMK